MMNWRDQDKKGHPTRYLLSDKEWERIKYAVVKPRVEEERAQAQLKERERKNAECLEATADWENNIKNMKERRMKQIMEKAEKEEEVKKLEDVEGAIRRAKEKQAIIDEAEKLIHCQKDEVKRLHQAMMYTEVLRERQNQLVLKNALRDEERKMDGVLEAQAEENRKKKIEEERQRMCQYQNMVISNTKDILEQVKMSEQKRAQEKEAGWKETEENARKYQEYLKEQQDLKEKKWAARKLLKEDNEKQLRDREYMKQIVREREEKAARDLQKFEVAAGNLNAKLKERAGELKRDIEMQRQKLRDNVAGLMKTKQMDEMALINKCIAERDAESKRVEDEKREKRTRIIADLDAHRKSQMERNAQAEQAAKEEGRREFLKAQESLDQWNQQEKDRLQKRREEAKKVTEFLHQQWKEKLDKEGLDGKRDRKIKEEIQQKMADEEKAFQTYASEIIKDYEERGANTHPLKVEAGKGLGVMHKPAENKNALLCSEKMKPHMHKANTTAERLGFVW